MANARNQRSVSWRFHALTVAVCLSAVMFRLQLPGAVVSPDGQLYIRLAQNLAQHRCLSESDPQTAQCIPSWGGQPPGYPLFIASLATFVEPSAANIIAAQSVTFGVALLYLLLNAVRLPVRPSSIILAGLVVALSPAVAGISRWVLTETLAAAAGLCVFAESCRALAEKRMSIVRVGIAVAAASMIRWDMLFVVLLPLAVALYLLPPGHAIAKWLGILSLSLVPHSLLVTRAVLLGLTIMPSSIRATPEEVPPGMLHFWQRAAVSERATQAFLWGVWGRQYQDIRDRRDWNSFLPRTGPTEFDDLLARMGALPDGAPVPASMNLEYEAAANELALHGGVRYWMKAVMIRIYRIWFWPERLFSWFLPDSPRLKAIASTERLLFLSLLLATLIFARDSYGKILALGIFAILIARTTFLACVTALEIRYLIPTLPLMQFAACAFWDIRTRVVQGSRSGTP